jgi:hypothetical protein
MLGVVTSRRDVLVGKLLRRACLTLPGIEMEFQSAVEHQNHFGICMAVQGNGDTGRDDASNEPKGASGFGGVHQKLNLRPQDVECRFVL